MNDTNMPKEIGMAKRTPSASIPKFIGIGKIIKTNKSGASYINPRRTRND